MTKYNLPEFKIWTKEKNLDENDKFKVLPTYLFHYVKESKEKKEAKAEMAFSELVREIKDFESESVFIPLANKRELHWNLVVYEVREKKFYHWDSLGLIIVI